MTSRHLELRSLWFRGLVTAIVLLFAIGIGIIAGVPPVSRDALTHHLAVPKLYLKHGGLVELPGIAFSYYPMNLDLLYLVPLFFGNDILPKYIHFTFAVLTAGLIYVYMKGRLGGGYGLAGVLLFISLPVIVKLSTTVYVDLGLVFFSFASLYFLMHWREDRFRWQYLILSAVFCGLALGTKYNGLLVFCLHTLFVAFISAPKTPASVDETGPAIGESRSGAFMRPLLYMGVYAGVALIVFSPWAVRNIIWKGNPVYPLYHSVFQTVASDADASPETEFETLGGKFQPPVYTRKLLYGESWWYAALTPLRIFVEGRDDDPQFFDGRLNPYLLLLTLLALWRLRADPARIRFEKKLLVAFAGCYLLFVFFSADMRIRYVAPIIAPMALLAVYGLQRGITEVNRMPRPKKTVMLGAGILVMAALLVLNVAYLIRLYQAVDPLSYISGRVDRQTYITRHRPEHTVYSYANGQLDADARILGIFLGKRMYYLDRDVIFDVEMLKKSVQAAASWEMILQNLSGQGFSHILVRHDIFRQWSQHIFDRQALTIMADFFHYGTRRLISAGGYGLYALDAARYADFTPDGGNSSRSRKESSDGGPPKHYRPATTVEVRNAITERKIRHP
jgi:4-amino-4-deoxy-L-arabinose transferase-like glycosyltransferase